MAANDLTFTQLGTVLTSIAQQATGEAALTPTDTSSFITVAQTALLAGPDPVLNAINQVLSRTIFSVRPYSRKFKGLEVSETAFGNHVRKLTVADKVISDDDRYAWPVGYDATELPPSGDGESVDQYVLNKPSVLQTNFYGSNVFSDSYTIFKDQLDNAFSGPDQFGSFLAMVTQNMTDKLEHARETLARATIANYMGGLVEEAATDRVIYLLSEYNTLTGLSLTSTTVYDPDNFGAFCKWAYSRIAQVSSLMTERSGLFQTQITGFQINRHTPVPDQRVYLFAPARYQIDARVLADTYHDSYLSLADVETVNFWQSISTPDTINVVPVYIDASGDVTTPVYVPPAVSTVQDKIFGIIFDREAMGYATTQQWSKPTPFNARGGYSNIWLHETCRTWNDHTEKAAIFILD